MLTRRFFGIRSSRINASGVCNSSSSTLFVSSTSSSSSSLITSSHHSCTGTAAIIPAINSLYNNNESNSSTSSCCFSPILCSSHRYQSSSSDRLLQCSACGKTFRLPGALNHHIMTRHGGQAKIIQVGADGKPIPDATTATSTATSSNAAETTPQQQQQQATQSQQQAPRVPSPTGLSDQQQMQMQMQQAQQQTHQPPLTEEDVMGSKKFECHICQKSFRLEAALAHHYQVKHGCEMPSSASGGEGGATTTTTQESGVTSSSSSTTSRSEQSSMMDSTSTSTTMDSTSAATSATQPQQAQQQQHFIRSTDVVTPQPPQYHLDAAPNAPEEVEIAVHSRCVNNIVLIGQMQDVNEGYVFEDKVLQFVLMTNFDNPAPGDPDKDFHTVRVHGENFSKAVSDMINRNSTTGATSGRKLNNNVMVSGRLRMIPQYEPSTGRYYHFPIIQVQEGVGSVNFV